MPKSNESGSCQCDVDAFHCAGFAGLAVHFFGFRCAQGDGNAAQCVDNVGEGLKVNDDVPDGALKKLEYGISLDGQKLKPAKVKRINKNSFYIILTEGKNRQIRRMCQKIGFEVIVLKRLRIADILLNDLKEGDFQYLTKDEIYSILKK